MAFDLLTYKIPNWLITIGLASGFVSNVYTCSFIEIKSCVIGIFIPLFLLWILFALNMLGAGDIKLFCVIGCFIGTEVVYVIALSFVFGAIIATVKMFINKNFLSRIYIFFLYLKSSIQTKNFQEYHNQKQDNFKNCMHFSVAIFIGLIVFISYKHGVIR